MRTIVMTILVLAILAAGCQVVPGTGDKSTDAASAANYVPTSIAGYNATDATSIADALSKGGASVGVLTGNVATAALVAKLDNMIQCYKGVGAVSSEVFTEQNPTLGSIPKVGAIAVINETRLQRNFVSCALNIVTGPSAQDAATPKPCGNSGSFMVNNEKLDYVFGATTPELCTIFQQKMPAS